MKPKTSGGAEKNELSKNVALNEAQNRGLADSLGSISSRSNSEKSEKNVSFNHSKLRLSETPSPREEILEKLASIEHEQWVEWSKNLAKTEVLSERRLQRWQELWIPYFELHEDAKEHDRKWARKAIDFALASNGKRIAVLGCKGECGAFRQAEMIIQDINSITGNKNQDAVAIVEAVNDMRGKIAELEQEIKESKKIIESLADENVKLLFHGNKGKTKILSDRVKELSGRLARIREAIDEILSKSFKYDFVGGVDEVILVAGLKKLKREVGGVE